ncbi:Mu transposase C-terminal domain-containing protein [Defluviimonas salinarum]|uniref:Mu transposase C-terminal domain-containing protein n=1 Tax=Defluviimonas salinarum TaxID=2992147 RepID=A0ABT3JAH0_9RHOB|nr:Mu transposase C-terminal domain-containing protein [Defluviimonas salinarum]MCW3784703.1 Mu transposase C-terminal domain-containing protein [Defluviimonas salinarum]
MSLLEAYDGRYIRLDSELYRVLGREAGKPSILVESTSGDRLAIAASDFRMHISLGNVSEGLEPDFRSRLNDQVVAEEMAFRRELLTRVAKCRNEGHTWESALRATHQGFLDDGRYEERCRDFPKVRTVQLWREKFLREGSNALRDRREQSGNRRDRHDPIFEEIVFDLLEEQFLTSDRMTVSRLCKVASDLYVNRCKGASIEPASHGRKVVESLIASLPHDDVVKMRLGSKEARKRLLQAGRFQTIKAPFDRIEIDSTQADVFVVVGENGETARPWVTAAIDAATGLIVGMTVTLDRTSGLTTAVTLREAMTLTPASFFDANGIEARFQAHGNPLTVVADQGPENKGDLLSRLIASTGIESQLAIPGHPEKKPFIERFFRTFSMFVTQLPGATQTAEMPAKTRTNRATSEALLTLDDFVRDVQRWRFDVYARTPRRRIQSVFRRRESPIEAWRRMEEEFFIPEPPSLNELRDMFYRQKVTRRLHRYGIELNGIQYSSEALRYIQKTQGASEVDVWLNPTDIREIAVINPISREAIYVPAKDPEMPAISTEELKRIRRSLKIDPSEELSAERILAALVGKYHRAAGRANTPQRKALEKARADRRDADILSRSMERPAVDLGAKDLGARPAIPVTRPQKLAKISNRRE